MLSGPAAYLLLARTQWKVSRRALKARQSLFMWIVIGLMLLYAAFVLVVLGAFFPRFSQLAFPDVAPVEVVNQYILATFVSLFFLRFLFQKTPQMKVVPFLHLPISRPTLVRFFQVSSLGSIHNTYPLLFFLPFWVRYVVPDAGPGGAVWWLVAVGLLILTSHFGNLFLRSVLRQRTGLFYALIVLLMVTAFVDEWMGAGLQRTLSRYLFADILAGSFTGMALLGAATALSVLVSTRELLGGLRPEPPAAEGRAAPTARIDIPESWGVTGQLVRLELLLMWRNRRPRHYLIISVLFSTMYLLVMLGPGNALSGMAIGAMVGLFASGGFILNYGQLMFSWDSQHYSALVTRNIPFRYLVKAKLIVLQASCVALFVVSMPIFVLIKPEFVPLHFAFLFYNAGITSVLVMELASRNRQPIDIGRSGGFFNYEGFSARHWIWFIPTALPPILFMTVMQSHPKTALVVLSSIGFVSILATDVWTRYFAAALHTRKHAMLEGFRSGGS